MCSGFEPSQLFRLQPVNGRDAIEHLFARRAGLLGALIGERHERGNAAGGNLVDEDWGIQRAHPGGADQARWWLAEVNDVYAAATCVAGGSSRPKLSLAAGRGTRGLCH